MGAESAEIGAAYRAHLEALGVGVDDLEPDERGTVGRAVAEPGTLPPLPPLAIERPGSAEPADLRLGALIGEGATSAVSEAIQVSLERRVAVKQLRTPSAVARAQLVHEARVLGALDHPNVVPVYALGRDDEGNLLLVMKRIEGQAWRDLLEPLYPPRSDPEGDPVDRHLRILVQVCHAIELAHAKRIVHRDLKPENVMIGAFGEVYVVDWGIALSLDAPVGPGERANTIAGTPAYMAPEMALGDREGIDERSDVYLLGAVLHELITGHAPHAAETVLASLGRAFAASPPEFDPGVPRELAEICRRAMRAEPAARHHSVGAFRAALLEFLDHRASSQVSVEASLRAKAYLEARADGAEARAHELATEARFGYRQALRSWPGNVEAKRGLTELITQMIGHAIAREDVQAASSLLGELPDASPELEAEVEALTQREQAQKARVAELERFRQAADPGLDFRWRIRTLVVLGTIAAVPASVLTVLRVMGLHRAGYPEAVGIVTLLALGLVGIEVVMRRHPVNDITLRLHRAVAVGLGLVACSLAVGWFAGAELSISLAHAVILIAAPTAVIGVLVDLRFLISTVPLPLAAAAIVEWPDYRGPIFVVGLLASFAHAAYVWRAVGRD